jgi:IMP dehydrogenase/GMP reductase
MEETIKAQIQNNLDGFIKDMIDKKKKHAKITRQYALDNPERTRRYANNYYHRNKDDPEFQQKARERALNYYNKKKHAKEVEKNNKKEVLDVVNEMINLIVEESICNL